jgi:hypothetical protein
VSGREGEGEGEKERKEREKDRREERVLNRFAFTTCSLGR